MNSTNPALFHVSEEANLNVFEPRRLEGGAVSDPVVWAIDEPHLVNYLLPRDCPRVTFGPGIDTSEIDCARFLAVVHQRIVAIEAASLARAMNVTLHIYSLPAQTFELFDASAGYWLSREEVKPQGLTVLPSALLEIPRRGVELRILERLWPLHESVVNSTLEFSMIRMRNALK